MLEAKLVEKRNTKIALNQYLKFDGIMYAYIEKKKNQHL